MKENWNSYLCKVNDELASIFLNLALRELAPMEERPFLLWVWLKMNSPRPDGLSSQDEFDQLLKIENELTANVCRKCNAVLAGTITTQGRREFYFYAADANWLGTSVEEALQKFPGYSAEFGSQTDESWSQFLNVLFPSGEELQRMGNRSVLDVLADKGDDHSLPHDVRHWLYFSSEADRQSFIDTAISFGYKIASKYELNEGGQEYCVEIFREQTVEQKDIDESSLELYRLAKQFNGEYDGWETQVTN